MVDMNDDPTNLIVNFLPQLIDEDQLQQLFSPYGQLEHVRLVRDRHTRQSLGYAFVKYSNVTEAQLAIQTVSGISLQGKTIKVAVAKNRNVHSAKPNVYVAGIPQHWTEVDLLNHFKPFGAVVHAKILREASTGQSRGAGFVHYGTVEEATEAIKGQHGQIPPDGQTPLTVRFGQKQESCRNRGGGGGGGALGGPASNRFFPYGMPHPAMGPRFGRPPGMRGGGVMRGRGGRGGYPYRMGPPQPPPPQPQGFAGYQGDYGF